MSLKWIYENLKPPMVVEECSDIDDSCSNGSHDSDSVQQYCTVEKNGEDEPKYLQLKIEKTDDLRCTVAEESAIHLKRTTINSLDQPLKLKLLSRTGYYIGISLSGRVHGVWPNIAVNHLLMYPISDGVIKLQSAESGHYLAFNSSGHLYGEANLSKDNTEWEHWSIGKYAAFRSRLYAENGWWLGIKKNGRPKSGPNSNYGQKAIQFFIIPFN